MGPFLFVRRLIRYSLKVSLWNVHGRVVEILPASYNILTHAELRGKKF